MVNVADSWAALVAWLPVSKYLCASLSVSHVSVTVVVSLPSTDSRAVVVKDRFCTKRIDSNRESESPRSHANKTGFIKYWRYSFLTRTSDMLSVGAPKWRIQGRTRAWEGIGPHITPEYATHCEYMYVARLFLIAGLCRYSCTHLGMHRFNS